MNLHRFSEMVTSSFPESLQAMVLKRPRTSSESSFPKATQLLQIIKFHSCCWQDKRMEGGRGVLSDGTVVTWDTEETKQQRSRRRAEHVGSERKISKFKLGQGTGDFNGLFLFINIQLRSYVPRKRCFSDLVFSTRAYSGAAVDGCTKEWRKGLHFIKGSQNPAYTIALLQNSP